MRAALCLSLVPAILLFQGIGCSEDGTSSEPQDAALLESSTARDTSAGSVEAERWLLPQNQVRGGVKTTPALAALVWSEELAAAARDAVKICSFEHTTGPYGENIFAGNVENLTEAFIVKAWADEAAYYDPSGDTCSKEPCGHYRQLIARKAARVGCAIGACKGAFSQLAFCMYDPGIVSGEKPL